MLPSDHIIFALDYPTFEQAQESVYLLAPHVGGFKVGLELFIASKGRLPVTLFSNKELVLDLKLHDIPETVERAISAAAALIPKPTLMTLHVQQRETMERAAKRAQEVGIRLLAVTVLTSMNDQDCHDLHFREEMPAGRVYDLAHFCVSLGIKNFVCSPKEVGVLRREVASDGFFMVPGVRPAGTALGDQKRTGTPAQTIGDGADLIVVGRPIRDADDKIMAAKAIAAEIGTIESGLK
jgi:orotidine-5'-phosphate decarboxylase